MCEGKYCVVLEMIWMLKFVRGGLISNRHHVHKPVSAFGQCKRDIDIGELDRDTINREDTEPLEMLSVKSDMKAKAGISDV
jgi:hypothetical protein